MKLFYDITDIIRKHNSLAINLLSTFNWTNSGIDVSEPSIGIDFFGYFNR